MTNTDAELIDKCLKGDSGCYALLVDKYKNQIFTLILRLVQNPADAEDLAQDAFIKAYKNLSKYDKTRSFLTWLFKIAHNSALDFLRSKKITISIDDDENPVHIKDDSPLPDEIISSCRTAETVKDCIAALEPLQREILILSYKENLSYDEMANISGITVQSVKTRLFRARQALKKEILQRVKAPVETFF